MAIRSDLRMAISYVLELKIVRKCDRPLCCYTDNLAQMSNRLGDKG